MRTAVYRIMGDTAYLTSGSSPELATTDEVRLQLDMAAQDVCLKIFRQGVTLLPKNVDFDTVADQQEYALSGTTIVTDGDFLGLLLVEYQVAADDPDTYVNCPFPEGGDFRRKNVNRDSGYPNTSAPSLYLRGQTLGFCTVPTAVKTYTVHYAPRPTALSETTPDTDSLQNTIPVEYHQVVVYTAAVDLMAAEDSNAAERARLRKAELVEQMMATVGGRFRQQAQVRRRRR